MVAGIAGCAAVALVLAGTTLRTAEPGSVARAASAADADSAAEPAADYE
jgi:hypothetical protein